MNATSTVGNFVLAVFRGLLRNDRRRITIAMFGRMHEGSNAFTLTIGRGITFRIDPILAEHNRTHMVSTSDGANAPTEGLLPGRQTIVVWDAASTAQREMHAFLRDELPHGAIEWPIDIFGALDRGAHMFSPSTGSQRTMITRGLLVMHPDRTGELQLFTSGHPSVHTIATSMPNDRTAIWDAFHENNTTEECALSHLP